ncbi:hypothetical protein D6C44_004295 [Escherichia coli]|nr:hypothetical protein [Escherichia coli]EEY1461115.1 hypothetical protein [Escherichia coli]
MHQRVTEGEALTGEIFTRRIECNNLALKPRIKRLARKTICFSHSVELHEIQSSVPLSKNICSTNWS